MCQATGRSGHLRDRVQNEDKIPGELIWGVVGFFGSQGGSKYDVSDKVKWNLSFTPFLGGTRS